MRMNECRTNEIVEYLALKAETSVICYSFVVRFLFPNATA